MFYIKRISIPDLVKCEDEGSVVFFPMGGNNLERWVSKMKGLNKPEFYLLDSDAKKPGVKSEHKNKLTGLPISRDVLHF